MISPQKKDNSNKRNKQQNGQRGKPQPAKPAKPATQNSKLRHQQRKIREPREKHVTVETDSPDYFVRIQSNQSPTRFFLLLHCARAAAGPGRKESGIAAPTNFEGHKDTSIRTGTLSLPYLYSSYYRYYSTIS
jgi:hypothetical protein